MDYFGPEFYEKVLEEYLSKKGKTAVTLSNNGESKTVFGLTFDIYD